MTQITATIIEDAEAFIKEEVPDMCVDGIAAVYPRTKFDNDFGRVYYDQEEEINKYCTLSDHVEALALLAELIDNKLLFVGGIESASELADTCNWDVEVVDAYFQLLYHGEVIYG